MLKNEDLNAEIWQIIHDQHWVNTDLAERMGMPDTNFYRILKRDHVDKKIIELMEILGYDVEVKFVRKRRR